MRFTRKIELIPGTGASAPMGVAQPTGVPTTPAPDATNTVPSKPIVITNLSGEPSIVLEFLDEKNGRVVVKEINGNTIQQLSKRRDQIRDAVFAGALSNREGQAKEKAEMEQMQMDAETTTPAPAAPAAPDSAAPAAPASTSIVGDIMNAIGKIPLKINFDEKAPAAP